MAAGTQYDKNLNMDAVGIKTPAIYDANQDEWLMPSALFVKSAAGVWVPLQIDANDNLRASVKDAVTLESRLDALAVKLQAITDYVDTLESGLGTPADPEAEDGDGSLVALTKRLRTLMSAEPVTLQATIVTGQSVSTEVELHNAKYLGFCFPVDLDGATTISFLAYNPAIADFAKLVDDTGAEVTISVTAGAVATVDVAALKLAPVSRLKIRLGTEAAPVTATADRTIYVIAKR